MVSDNEYFKERLDSILDSLREIKEDLSETKRAAIGDMLILREKQATCDSRWVIVGKTLSWSGFSAVIGALVALVFPKGH